MDYKPLQISITRQGDKFKVIAMDDKQIINSAEFNTRDAVLEVIAEELEYLLSVEELEYLVSVND